jgi:hypothetical protein
VTNKSALVSFTAGKLAPTPPIVLIVDPRLSGTYICVAKNFAYHEMRYVLARLLLAFDMSLPASFDARRFREKVYNKRTTGLGEPLLAIAKSRTECPNPGVQ